MKQYTVIQYTVIEVSITCKTVQNVLFKILIAVPNAKVIATQYGRPSM